MKSAIFCSLFVLGLLTGCGSLTSSMPDEFWAYGTWRYDGDETKLTVAAKGTAFITMHFTRQQGEQYLIEGDVTYDSTSLSCDVFYLTNQPVCGVDTCTLSEVVPGELTGVAEVRGDKLVMMPRWVTKPDEIYTWTCEEGYDSTNSTWSVWQTMGPLGAGIVEATWEVDIGDALFVDELPLNEVTDAKVISANFSTTANDNVSAEGVIGFYTELP